MRTTAYEVGRRSHACKKGKAEWALARDLRTVRHGHHGPLHGSDRDEVSSVAHETIRLADRDLPASAQNLCACDEKLAPSGRKQIDLELDAEDAHAMRHQAERRIAARAVENRRDDAGVKEAVLLGEIVSPREMDLHVTWRDAFQPRSDGSHDALLGKALANGAIEIRVG